LAGIEEHYFPRLAKIAVDRLSQDYHGIYTNPDVAISALFTRLIPGFGPFPKMSKSISASGVFLDDTDEDIYRKIVETNEAEYGCVYEMICQASDWDDYDITTAKQAYARAAADQNAWREVRVRYAATFTRYATYWRQAKALARL
jgi:tryptophanyl-tRNA synthetase